MARLMALMRIRWDERTENLVEKVKRWEEMGEKSGESVQTEGLVTASPPIRQGLATHRLVE